jgi:tight adherence protein C
MSNLWLSFGLVFLFLAFAGLTLALYPDVAAQAIRRRVRKEIGAANPPTVLSQMTEALAPLNRYLPSSWYGEGIGAKLAAAGLRIPPIQFLVLQQMGGAGGTLLYFLVVGGGRINIGWLALFAFIGSQVPKVWLNSRIQARRQTISRDLPEIVDLLTLCVDAGVDFLNALTRVVREFRPCPTTEELGLLLHEVRVGKRRRDALKAFADRVQTSEATSLSRTLIQADRMGTGLAEAMQILSEDMRMQRAHWAERFAQQAPTKMLIPLLCSMGSAMIVVAGPVLGQFLTKGFDLNPSAITEGARLRQ